MRIRANSPDRIRATSASLPRRSRPRAAMASPTWDGRAGHGRGITLQEGQGARGTVFAPGALRLPSPSWSNRGRTSCPCWRPRAPAGGSVELGPPHHRARATRGRARRHVVTYKCAARRCAGVRWPVLGAGRGWGMACAPLFRCLQGGPLRLQAEFGGQGSTPVRGRAPNFTHAPMRAHRRAGLQFLPRWTPTCSTSSRATSTSPGGCPRACTAA